MVYLPSTGYRPPGYYTASTEREIQWCIYGSRTDGYRSSPNNKFQQPVDWWSLSGMNL